MGQTNTTIDTTGTTIDVDRTAQTCLIYPMQAFSKKKCTCFHRDLK